MAKKYYMEKRTLKTQSMNRKLYKFGLGGQKHT